MIENELPGIEEAFIFTHVVFPRRANANYRDSCLMYASYMQIQVARKCFLPASVLYFHSFNRAVSNFNEPLLINFFLSWVMLFVVYLESHCQSRGHLDFVLR